MLGSFDIKLFKRGIPTPVTFEIEKIGQIVLLGIDSANFSKP